MTGKHTRPVVHWPPDDADRFRQAGYWQDQWLAEPVWAHARCNPSAIALIDGSRRTTYGELVDDAEHLAAALHADGLDAGDVVLVQLPNCVEFVVLVLACLRLGAVPLLVIPGLRAAELSSLARHSDAVAIAVPDTHRGFDHQQLAHELVDGLPTLRRVLVVGRPTADSLDLRALARGIAGVTHIEHEPPRGDDVAVLLTSGGTTGTPKIIPRTHNDYGYNMRRCAELAAVSAASTYLAVLPAAHNFGFACPGAFGTLVAGGRVVLSPTTRPDECFRLIEAERVTVTSVVPTIARRWVTAASGTACDLTSLAVLQVGGESMPAELAVALSQAFPAILQQTFGMAEGLLTFTRLDDPPEIVQWTAGRPICPDDQILVVDEQERPVEAGHTGSLITKGPYTIRGYFGEVGSDEAFTDGGWYRSGDLVHVDSGGNVVVDGRTKDVIVRAGEKVSAAEIERLVVRMRGVVHAAALAAPSAQSTEAVCLFVVLDQSSPGITLGTVQQAMREAGVASYKLPERLEVIGELPLTPVGKVDKIRLRRELDTRDAR
ncbi:MULTISPECIES: (2,3-dihydroxybenzoyl)adenylate synthase [unclassified Mycobacterium]|uniref:(2,3-dihydroxybenzoyl)adenylate synthase n=1 Tax=unclassified Mycobacterium TaxID=2642494 RepID=UPI0029C716B9|nr:MULTISPECIES: AMP-binding protein [unclassified Mycobacterium]